jgi:hypothetical protein
MFEDLKQIAVTCIAATCAVLAPGAQAGEKPAAKSSDATAGMSMRGNQEGTAFQSLTVEGEDRVHFKIERPPLVLDRTVPDGVAPFLRGANAELSPYLARPWLRAFAYGDVAGFQPQVDGVETWRLVVADSRGQAVRTFEGRGQPPQRILWDGRSSEGEPAQPGRTYSYIFEARDRAGNKRNFVGEGFQVAAYRLETAQGPVLAFTGSEGASARSNDGSPRPASPFVLEAASWINQTSSAKPVRVTATARNNEQANALAKDVSRSLAPMLLGDPARVQVQTHVQADAFEAGTVQIAPVP